MAKQRSLKDLYKDMGLSDSQVSSKGTVKADTAWKTELLKPLSQKKYGKSYDAKLNNILGDPWAAKDFERFMTYRDANKTIQSHKASEATNNWQKSFDDNKKKQAEAEKKRKKAEQKPLLPDVKSKTDNNSFLGDMLKIGKGSLESALHLKNPLQASTDIAKDYVKKGQSPTDATKEVSRGITRAANTAAFGVIKEAANRKNDPFYQNEVFNERKGGAKAADFAYDALGYMVPGVGGYQALNASKAGKALTEFGSKSIPKRLLTEAAKGTLIGAGMSGAEVAAREGINPTDYNWKDNTKHIAFGAGTGFIADPLLYGAGKGIAKGFESASNSTMRNILPSNQQVEGALRDSIKSFKGTQALPKTGGVQNPGIFNDLMPRGSDITNPSFLPPLKPRTTPQVEVPKIWQSVDEILANPIPVPKIKTAGQSAPEMPVTSIPEQLSTIQQAPKQGAVIQEQMPKAQGMPKSGETVPPQETTVQAPKEPKPNERSFYQTVQNPEKLSPELEQRLNDFDKTYKPMSNEETVKFANEYVARDMEKAFQFVKNARKFDARHVTVGHRLIDELQKAGKYDRALDVVERLAEQGTKAGQSIQSYSIYNRLSAEGQLLRAQRRVNQINETITDPSKQVKLTEQNIQDITHTADSIKRFTGQAEQASDVMKIMEKIKKGNVATDAELDTVRSFVSDAKKFVSDLDPGAQPKQPKVPKDVRTRDKVVEFMDKREQLARERLRQIMNRANSMPVDAIYALADIGASKIAKGTVKLADFTEEMVKEFGEMVRPYAKQIYNKAADTFNLQSESLTRQRLSEVEKITNKALKDKNLSVDDADTIREFARQVGAMSGDAKLEASMELQTTLQLLERPTFGRKIATAQTIGQLLNPKTIGRNAIGNEMFYWVEKMNKLLATPIDIARSKITGGERTITFRTHNQGEYWKNFMIGGKAGWKGVNPMGLQTAYDLGPQSFRSKWNPLTYLEKSLGATLRSFDHAAYMRAHNNTLGELATLKAVNQGLKGQAKKDAIKQFIREADANMIQMADQYGKYVTFQDNTALSSGLQKVKRAMNFKQDFGLGDMILKYPKTPGNLVMRALEYSPAGILRSGYLLRNIMKVKDPLVTREATESFTRALIGTGGFSILGYALADAGVLTGGGNSDYDLANLERTAGKQPNSVNISALKRFIESGFNKKAAGTKKGDTFVSYDWAQPLSIAVSLGTGVNQSVKESKGELDGADATKGALNSAANTVINQSVLKGLNDFLASYPGRTMSDRFEDVAKGVPSSFTPTLLNQVKQSNNNAARTTYDNTYTGEMSNRVLNRLPGLDSKLPPSYDTLGNKRETYQGGSNNLFNVFLNPSFVSKYNPSPEADALLNYINETGDTTLAPRMADKKIEGTKLTGEQYAELQRIIGTETKKGLQDLLPKLKNPNDNPDVGKDIYNLLNAAGKAGKGEIRKQIVTKEQLDEAKRKYGLDADTIYDRLKKGKTLQWSLTTPEK